MTVIAFPKHDPAADKKAAMLSVLDAIKEEIETGSVDAIALCTHGHDHESISVFAGEVHVYTMIGAIEVLKMDLMAHHVEK